MFKTTKMTKKSLVSSVSGLLAAALLAGAMPLSVLAEATPEEAAAVTVDSLVNEGTSLAGRSQAELEALLAEIGAARADANAAELARLADLEAAVADSLQAGLAADAGTLTDLPQTGEENSWRYQNGTPVENQTDGQPSGLALSPGEESSIFTYGAGGNAHLGIDVSRHQGSIDWNAVKSAGIEFAIIRCGYGDNETDQDDAQWAANVSACESLGIPYGVYLYSYATDTDHARSEAEHVLRLVAGHRPALPIFLDLEENRTLAQGTEAIGAMAQVFCDRIQQAGYAVGIYANQLWWNYYLTASNFSNSSWYRWAARYGSPPEVSNYVAWQFASDGQVAGISGNTDMNYWYGDLSSNVTPTPTLPPVDEGAARAFVSRLYQVCLGRTADAGGLADWTAKLTSRQQTGAQVASGFVFSNEFKNKNYCNEDYSKQLYRAFLGREYDTQGLANWVHALESGTTREAVFNGFAQSNEFTTLCESYGITRGGPIPVPTYGTVPTGPCTVDGKEDGVTTFVKRLYSTCLDRVPDPVGLRYWTAALWNHTASGSGVAAGFIFSREFIDKSYNDTDYVKHLYRAFLGREHDAPGLANWLSKLHSGSSRQQVFRGFVESTEFTTICNSYGIVRG